MKRLLSRRTVSLARFVASVALLLLAYFVFPVQIDEHVYWQAAVTVASVVALTWVVSRALHSDQVPLTRLVYLLELTVIVTSLVCFSVAQSLPDQFSGLDTRLDALYFTIITMTTIGYGDIHPTGQLARAIVVGVVIFDLLFVTALGGAIVAEIEKRR